MNCDKCKSSRIFNIFGKSSDMHSWQYEGRDGGPGYAPSVEHICGGDYIDVTVCLDCGKVQGDFPVSSDELEAMADKGPYYFHAAECPGYGCKGYGGRPMVLVTITSQEYWDKNHYVSDWHLQHELLDILPKGFAETMESIFESKYSLAQTKKKLLDAGFLEDEEFTTFCDEHNDFA